jgi:N-methylhydantoinase A
MRVATDVGGTFTDLVFVTEAGEIGFAKSSTTPPHYEEGVLNVLDKTGIPPVEIQMFIHGTTVIINALTERKGVKTALITTKGFRDVLEIGRGNRPDLFNVRYQKPKAIIPRYLRREVQERLNYKGDTILPLDKGQLEKIVIDLKKEEVEAIAIVFLHSYKNPLHELEATKFIKQLWPEVSVTASHEITKEWREYERTNTTAMNSYIKPIASSYIDKLEQELTKRSVIGKKFIMQSNGGTTSFSRAKIAPINMVESGPVAGVFGTAILGHLLGEDQLISLDVGGTTAKCSLIDKGNVKITTDYYIEKTQKWAGYPLKIPVVDIVEIGNGGGSIAWVESTGSLRVGPHSAGAIPGPIAYGNGGTEPTITDAHLLTGRLSPSKFDNEVDLQQIREAVHEKIAKRFNLKVEDAALGIIRLANSNMLNALKLISVRKGYDPRDFTMVAFGGGGPLHATSLAKELGIRKVIVPAASAVFSAWGMLLTDLRQDFIQTYIKKLTDADLNELNTEWDLLERQALEQFIQEGIREKDILFSRHADIRYVGQEHTVKVPVRGGILDDDALAHLIESFGLLHEKAYTFKLEAEVEMVNLHLTGFGRVDHPPLKKLIPSNEQAFPEGKREIYFEEDGWILTEVFNRDHLKPSMKVQGPAVIEDQMSSVLIYPAQSLEVDLYGNLIIFTGGISDEAENK